MTLECPDVIATFVIPNLFMSIERGTMVRDGTNGQTFLVKQDMSSVCVIPSLSLSLSLVSP